MTNYRRGTAAEYRAKRLLERRGWFVVRSAGSHSPADLICLRQAPCTGTMGPHARCALIVQVKRNAYLSRPERATLLELKAYGRVEVWRFVGRGKPLVEVL